LTNFQVHETAEVHPSSQIGEGTRIWHQAQVMQDSKIGSNCNLGKSVYIDATVTIGNRVKIQNGVSVFRGVTVEDDCFLGPHMVFTNDLTPRSFNHEFEITKTHLKRGTSIGANATLVCGITLGEFSMVGAGSVVTKDVAPYTLVIGNPARVFGHVCECGKRANPPISDKDFPPKCRQCEL
jgi:acetyltransferase-like isoleucine patch superfamily enzyme